MVSVLGVVIEWALPEPPCGHFGMEVQVAIKSIE